MKNITMKTTWGNRESIDINDKEYTKVWWQKMVVR